MIFGNDFANAATMLDGSVMIADQYGLSRVYATLVLHIGLMNTRIAERKLEGGDKAAHGVYLKMGVEQTKEAVQLARESGNRRVELIGSANLAEFTAVLGDFEEAEKWLENWGELEDIATPGNWVHFYYTVCDFELERGNIDAALEAGKKAIEAAKNILSPIITLMRCAVCAPPMRRPEILNPHWLCTKHITANSVAAPLKKGTGRTKLMS